MLTLHDPELGQPFQNGGTNEVTIAISKVAENGLVRSGSKLWRNGRILTDEDLLGTDTEWGAVSVQAISDDGVFLAGSAMQYALNAQGERTDVELGRKSVLFMPAIDLELMWETANKANQIFNPTRKDDDTGNNEVLEVDGDETYAIRRRGRYIRNQGRF